MLQAKDVLTELDTLGNADAIASRLRACGIKGVRGRSCDCPVARYVNSKVTPLTDYRFSIYHVYGYLALRGGVTTTPSEDTPPNVLRFIKGFDGRRYPDLVEEPTHA